MVYRDEREALRERAAAAERELGPLQREAARARELERRVQSLERELDRFRPRSSPQLPSPRWGALVTLFGLGVSVAASAGWALLRSARPLALAPLHPATAAQAQATVSQWRIPFTFDLSRSPLLFDGNHDRATDIAVWGRCGANPEASSHLGLQAIDGRTGRAMWTACGVTPPGRAPAFVLRDLIAVWSGQEIIALDADTGRVAFRLAPEDGTVTGFCAVTGDVLTAVLADGGRWVVDAAGRGTVLPPAPDACLAEVWDRDFQTDPDGIVVQGSPPQVSFVRPGGPRWEVRLPSPEGVEADGGRPAHATRIKESVYVTYQPNQDHGLLLAKIDIETGQLMFSRPVGNDVWTMHDVTRIGAAADTVFVVEPWHVFALSARDGTQRFDAP